MTKMNNRFATKADYDAGRRFVFALYSVDCNGMSLTEVRPLKIFHDVKYNTYRLNPYGKIESTELGILHQLSRSTYSSSGVIIDLAENEGSIRSVALAELPKIRDKMVERMEAELKKFTSARVVIAGKVQT